MIAKDSNKNQILVIKTDFKAIKAIVMAAQRKEEESVAE